MSITISENDWRRVSKACDESEDYRKALESLLEVVDKRAELSSGEVKQRFDNARTILEKHERDTS